MGNPDGSRGRPGGARGRWADPRERWTPPPNARWDRWGPPGHRWDAGSPWQRGQRPGPPVRLAVFVAVVQIVGTHAASYHQASPRHLDSWADLLLFAGPLALLLRRRYRVLAVGATIAATVVYLLLGYPYGPVVFAPFVAAIGALRAGKRVPVWILAGLGYAAYVGLGWLPAAHLRHPGLGDSLLALVWVVVIMLLGEASRVQSRYLVELSRTRAEQARTRAEQERRQASEARLRIAQELHDVLGHHLSLINVQAGVGLHLMDEQPEQARTALAAIKQASAEALREVRSVLGVLRAEDEQAPRAPAPSLANLAALADDAGARTVIEGEPRPLPAELDRAAYRIAQEALTNVRRHAGPAATATVTISYESAALRVLVEDDGPGWTAEPVDPSAPDDAAEVPPADPSAEGSGIAGMRARAAALGGSLSAGNGPAGGFRVEARLPLGSDGS